MFNFDLDEWVIQECPKGSTHALKGAFADPKSDAQAVADLATTKLPERERSLLRSNMSQERSVHIKLEKIIFLSGDGPTSFTYRSSVLSLLCPRRTNYSSFTKPPLARLKSMRQMGRAT